MAAAIGFWLTFPDSGALAPQAIEPTPVGAPPVAQTTRAPTPRPSARSTPRAQRGKAAGGGRARGGAAAAREARPEPGAGASGEREVPEAVIDAIEQARARNVAESEAKVIAWAERSGWSDAQRDEVLGLVSSAHADVDRLLTDVTAGELAWRDAKVEVRQVRIDQARAIREELGDEAFLEFARALKTTSGRGRRGGRGGR